MNQDETVELFLKGREAWNEWANALLAERKAMEEAGAWKSSREYSWKPEKGENPETQAWLEKASASFSRCLFLVRGAGTKETAGEDKKEGADSEPPVKSIQLEADHADFEGFVFPGNADFASATFTGDAHFESATFTGNAYFASATFNGDAYFRETRFKQKATFNLANFKQYASFASSRFDAEARFNAIRGERGFSLADAVFGAVPDFIQAHFDEAPRLDNVKVRGRWIARQLQREMDGKLLPRREKAKSRREAWGWLALHWAAWMLAWPWSVWRDAKLRVKSGIPARWRSLKRLAIQGHDTERELEYHARELRSQRFVTDWPLPFLFWGWVGFLRFWFGVLYGAFSDYGRSIFRPALLWLATIAVAALHYLPAQPDPAPRWQAGGGQGIAASARAYAESAQQLWSAPPPCFKGEPLPESGKLEPGKLYGLGAPAAGSTNALAEAIRLAFRNGSIFLDGGDDSARRTYGCLYGIQSFGGSPAPFVPGYVGDASGVQKVLSAIYLFLFGLALRNMLKMK
jgi:hypothetical protein